VVVPQRAMNRLRMLRKAEGALAQRLGRKPTAAELAEKVCYRGVGLVLQVACRGCSCGCIWVLCLWLKHWKTGSQAAYLAQQSLRAVPALCVAVDYKALHACCCWQRLNGTFHRCFSSRVLVERLHALNAVHVLLLVGWFAMVVAAVALIRAVPGAGRLQRGRVAQAAGCRPRGVLQALGDAELRRPRRRARGRQ